jgi:hypothetical protein
LLALYEKNAGKRIEELADIAGSFCLRGNRGGKRVTKKGKNQ